MKIIILTILLSTIFVGGGESVYPELLPECISEYTLVWKLENNSHCQDEIPWGDYYLYSCRITKWNEFRQGYYDGFALVEHCVYTPSLDILHLNISQDETYQIFMPLVINNPTIISHIP